MTLLRRKTCLSGIIFAAVAVFSPLQAVFNYASHITNGKQHIYFFNDIHEAYDKAPNQQIDLISFAKQLDAKMLTEEMTNTDTLQNYIADMELLGQINRDCMEHLKKEESERFPLRGLAMLARSQGVDAVNIDYRQWVDAWRSGRSITGRVAMQVLDAVINEIKQYNDNPIFNAYYQKTVAMITDVFKPLWDYLRTSDEPVCNLIISDQGKSIIAAIDADPRKKELKYSDYWIAYDSALFDCLLLHRLAQLADEHIIVCAGGFHCNLATELLEQSGFKKEYACGSPDLNPTAIPMQGFARHVAGQYDACLTEQGRILCFKEQIQTIIEQPSSAGVMTLSPLADNANSIPYVLVFCSMLFAAIGLSLYFLKRYKIKRLSA